MVLLAAWMACTGADRSSTPLLDAQDNEALPDLDAEVPTPAPDPTSTLMLGLASGQVPVDAVLDPKRGFVLVEVDDDRTDGRSRVAERVCGDRARARLKRLQEDLASRSDGGTRNVFSCDGAVCMHPAPGGDGRAGSYAFQAPDGRQTVAVVVRMAHPGSARAEAEIEDWVDGQLRKLVSQDCP